MLTCFSPVLGNRESHTNRAGEVIDYTLANTANEYETVAGNAVYYDESGNLTVDEDGRQYAYDGQNQLVRIQDAADVVLASYKYDAWGRRIEANIGGSVPHFYYEGQRVIEEHDGTGSYKGKDSSELKERNSRGGSGLCDDSGLYNDTRSGSGLRDGGRLRYHINGAFVQFRLGHCHATSIQIVGNKNYKITRCYIGWFRFIEYWYFMRYLASCGFRFIASIHW